MVKVKRFFILLIVFFVISLSFTSCIDYVQSVSLKGKNYSCYYKVAVSKMLFEMAGEDPNLIFEDIDFSDFPSNSKIRKIDTATDIGYEIQMKIKFNTKDQEEDLYLPFINEDNEYCFPFLIGDYGEEMFSAIQEESDETQGAVGMFLLDAKCRLFISKELVPDINYAYFWGVEDDYEIDFYDYGDMFCLEIPFLTLSNYESYDFSNIIIN